MRISDWCSDVCSSVLARDVAHRPAAEDRVDVGDPEDHAGLRGSNQVSKVSSHMGWDPPLVAEPGADTGDVVSLRPLVAPFVLPSRRRLGLAEAALAGAK